MNRSDWNIDKASDQRMVYVPKDTVIEFMKKVSKPNDFKAFIRIRLVVNQVGKLCQTIENCILRHALYSGF